MNDEKAHPIQGRVLGIDHITLPTRDLALAERFYVGLLGGTMVMRVDEAFMRMVNPSAPQEDVSNRYHTSIMFGRGPRVDLFLQQEGQPAPEHGHPHLAFEVRPEDILSLKAALTARGIPVEGPLQLGPPGHASIYFNDPFGNHLEFSSMGFSGEVQVRPPDMRTITYTWKE